MQHIGHDAGGLTTPYTFLLRTIPSGVIHRPGD